jgi:hypothetical protein
MSSLLLAFLENQSFSEQKFVHMYFEQKSPIFAQNIWRKSVKNHKIDS